MELYQRLMSELDADGQHFSDQISEIDLTDPEDARVLMPEQGADVLAHFGEDHFLERYQRYKAHIAEWRQQYPNLAAVDLRYEQQVVLEMKQGESNAQPILSAEKMRTGSSQARRLARPEHASPIRPGAPVSTRRLQAMPPRSRSDCARGRSSITRAAKSLRKASVKDAAARRKTRSTRRDKARSRASSTKQKPAAEDPVRPQRRQTGQ